MFNALPRMFRRRAMTLPVIGILAIAATACQGVGLTEARQAVDNQRAISEIEDRELRPIERELESLYENQILPRERELEDLWNQVQDLENGEFKDAYNSFQDPWAPGGAASLLQQEFNGKYAEIDRLYRELEAESRRIQIDQQFDNTSFGIDPSTSALEDERFTLQRQLDRLHQFGRRPIEDLYLQMNELNASNGWSQTDISAADDLNRQIADVQNEIANAYANGNQFNDQNQQELFAIEDELNFLRGEGFFPINDLYNRIAELENQLAATGAGVNAAGVVVNPDSTVGTPVDADVAAKIEQLEAEMATATEAMRAELDELRNQLDLVRESAQAEIDAFLPVAETVVVTEGDDISAIEAEIAALQQEIDARHVALAPTLTDLEGQISSLEAQIGDIFHVTDTGNAELQSQIDGLQSQIDALDSTAEDYADVKAGLEDQIEVLQTSIDQALASETASVADLQEQIDALALQKETAVSENNAAVAALEAQLPPLYEQIASADTSSTTTTTVNQDILDQIAAIEQESSADLQVIESQIDALEQLIADTEAPFLLQVSDLQSEQQFDAAGVPISSAGATGDATGLSDLQFEIDRLRNEAFEMEQDLNEKIRILEERRNKLQNSINSSSTGTADIAALEARLVLLHDELNALQNNGFDASRNHNIRMEELQNEAVRLEKELSIAIRAIEDQLWEMDGRIAEFYRSNNGSSFDPYAKFNERLKQIELERFELEQRRWDLDDEQQTAFNQFNNVGSEQQAEAEAKRAEVLDPLYDRINVLEDEIRVIRIDQRDLEDKLRDAQRLVDDQRRELENQTLDLIDDAVTAAEENAESLNALGEDGSLDGIDLSQLGDLEGLTTEPVQ